MLKNLLKKNILCSRIKLYYKKVKEGCYGKEI